MQSIKQLRHELKNFTSKIFVYDSIAPGVGTEDILTDQREKNLVFVDYSLFSKEENCEQIETLLSLSKIARCFLIVQDSSNQTYQAIAYYFEALLVNPIGHEQLKSMVFRKLFHQHEQFKPDDDTEFVFQYCQKNSLRILLAEDNPVLQEVVNCQFEQLGCHITTVANGEDCYKARIEENHHLIFMDIKMPVLSGLDATKKIRIWESLNRKNRISIVAMTAGVMTGEREKCFDVGMDDFVSKPVSIAELAKILKTYILSASRL